MEKNVEDLLIVWTLERLLSIAENVFEINLIMVGLLNKKRFKSEIFATVLNNTFIWTAVFDKERSYWFLCKAQNWAFL